MNDIILSTQNGEPVVSSREVAKNFGKEHKDVLKAINNLVAQNCAANLVGELAKLLCQNGVQIGQNRLFSWMRERGYLIKDPKRSDYNMPTQRAVEQGLFEIKETTVVHSDGHTSINKTPKVTGKGQIYFVNQFVKR